MRILKDGRAKVALIRVASVNHQTDAKMQKVEISPWSDLVSITQSWSESPTYSHQICFYQMAKAKAKRKDKQNTKNNVVIVFPFAF